MQSTKSFKINFLEDNDDHAELLQYYLSKKNPEAEISRFATSEGFLEHLDELKSKPELSPNLILLDVKVPKISGLDVLGKIDQDPFFRGIPVVMMSTSEATTDLERAYQCHANSYLIKPADGNFEEIAECLLNYWVNFNKAPKSVGA